MSRFCLFFLFFATMVQHHSGTAAENVTITGVPDYDWHAGCFGTAGGNLMGYWDRHGLSNLYTGPTGNGVAPLNAFGGNQSIRSMWASKAGLDGRPADKPGHMDDYWISYESTGTDPYVTAGRPEHEPDCIGDFVGASQNKWSDFDGECAGNIDAFAFNFWDKSGGLRANFTPPPADGLEVRDVQSGLRHWTEFRGYQAEVASQLVDFNPTLEPGHGFSFEDLRAEILRGNPVLLILQNSEQLSRDLFGMPNANPNIHAMVAFRYAADDSGGQFVQYRTSWGSGEANETWAVWGSQDWAANLPLRGVVLFRPLPKITQIGRANGKVTLQWEGPQSILWDELNQVEIPAHSYRVEQATSLGGEFVPVGETTYELSATIDDPETEQLYFRVKLAHPAHDTGGASAASAQ